MAVLPIPSLVLAVIASTKNPMALLGAAFYLFVAVPYALAAMILSPQGPPIWVLSLKVNLQHNMVLWIVKGAHGFLALLGLLAVGFAFSSGQLATIVATGLFAVPQIVTTLALLRVRRG